MFPRYIPNPSPIAKRQRGWNQGFSRFGTSTPSEIAYVLALLTADRLSLKRLNRPEEALRFYTSANASPVPHLDWDDYGEAGMADAEGAAAMSA